MGGWTWHSWNKKETRWDLRFKSAEGFLLVPLHLTETEATFLLFVLWIIAGATTETFQTYKTICTQTVGAQIVFMFKLKQEVYLEVTSCWLVVV